MTGPQQVAVALYDAINTADWSAARALLAPDVVGKLNDLVTAPEHVGAQALLEHLRVRRSLGEGSYRIDSWELQDHPQPEYFAMVLIRHSADVAGERIGTEALHVLRVDDGQVVLLAASVPDGQIDGRWLALVA